MNTNWMFDESVHTGVDYNNSDVVGEYDTRHEEFRDFRKEAENIISALKLKEDSVILDIGCGTGSLTVYFAQQCKHVYAVDISKVMLSVLNNKVQKQQLNNITTKQSGFLTYQHEGEKLDAIIASINLHHLPDFWKQIALCRFYDVLKPNGKMFLIDVVFDFEPRNYETVINNWINDFHNLSDTETSKEVYTHIREEFSTWNWIMEGMLERAGFQIESNNEMMSQMRAYVCTKM